VLGLVSPDRHIIKESDRYHYRRRTGIAAGKKHKERRTGIAAGKKHKEKSSQVRDTKALREATTLYA